MPEDYPGQKKDRGLGVQSLSPHANAEPPKANIYLVGGEASALDVMEGEAIISKKSAQQRQAMAKAEHKTSLPFNKRPSNLGRPRPATAGSSRPSTSFSSLPPWDRETQRPGTAASRQELPATVRLALISH